MIDNDVISRCVQRWALQEPVPLIASTRLETFVRRLTYGCTSIAPMLVVLLSVPSFALG